MTQELLMRKFLVALFVMIATHSNAFELNLSKLEIRRLKAEYLVDDLAVGVKAVVGDWAFCSQEEHLYINRASMIEEPSEYSSMFEVVLLPTGGVSVETIPAKKSFSRPVPFPDTWPCDKEAVQDLGFYAVKTIDGANNLADYISAALGKGFTIGNKTAARELLSVVEQQNHDDGAFTGIYEDKIKSAIRPCLVNYSFDGIPKKINIQVAVTFNRDGRVQPSSLLLVNHSTADSMSQVYFQGVRRAFLRCQEAGYLLPKENYDSWKSMIITFTEGDLF